MMAVMTATGMETDISADTHSQFLVKTKQTCAYINNNKTEVVCSAFEDYIFLIVTQYTKIGTLVHVYPENTVEGQKNPFISTRVIFGKDEPMIHVVAKNIHLGMSTPKPVLMSIALKDKSRETIFEINKLVYQCKIWI